MTLTIDLPEDVERQLLADAREQGADPAALVAALIANVYRVASARGIAVSTEEDAEAVREIGEALAEMEEAEAHGDYGRPIEQFWAEMDAEFGSAKRQNGSSTTR